MKLEPEPSAAGDVQHELAALERSATRLRYFLPAVPTGLIQTPEYMRHVMTQTSASGAGDVDRVIALKLERQAILDHPEKQFEFLLTESAIRWQLCGAAVMAGQIEHVLSLSRRPNVDVRVLPLSARVSEVPFNTFTVYDTTLATLEVFTGRVVLREVKDVEHYSRLFDVFAERACAEDAARQLLDGWSSEFSSSVRG
ncbi:DUF5753 domain-containing protein [Streptomyces barringtoniae]|uniref:DUF5753 domain-containing protein n=1 Tax=Streptomyces barringtoniae TaxID=2892029 RepID=UPI001E589B64|nr:DUF5753 domain-containing protein [Streptomyces barringtoniae]MCC5477426.1 DUF5753 domain-containing protein [Streptomyces barringtoniae]